MNLKSFHGWYYGLNALNRHNKAQQLEELCLIDTRWIGGGTFFTGFGNLRRLNMDFKDIESYTPIMHILICRNIDTLEYIGIKCSCAQYEDEGLPVALQILHDSINQDEK